MEKAVEHLFKRVNSMQKWEDFLLQMAVASWVFFAWLITTEVGLLPANWRGAGVLFRWQVWLLAGIVMVATRDFVSQVRCRCCGRRKQISPLGLLTSRELLCRSCLNGNPGVLSVELDISTANPLKP